MLIRIKRLYEPEDEGDGYRVLVDGLWPRGLAKNKARFARWARELAPSRDLRDWFGHKAGRWDAFRARYAVELDERPEDVERLLREARDGTLTLIYAARDRQHNNARALAEYLEKELRARQRDERDV